MVVHQVLGTSACRYEHNQREHFRGVYMYAHFSKVYVETDGISTVCFDDYVVYLVHRRVMTVPLHVSDRPHFIGFISSNHNTYKGDSFVALVLTYVLHNRLRPFVDESQLY